MGAAEDKPSSCPTCSQIFPNLEAANNGLSPHAATFCNTAYETPYLTRTSKSLTQPTGRSAQGIILEPGKKWSHVRAGSYDLMHESCPARMCLRPNQMSMRTWLLYLSTRSGQVLPAAIHITMKVTHPNPDCRSPSTCKIDCALAWTLSQWSWSQPVRSAAAAAQQTWWRSRPPSMKCSYARERVGPNLRCSAAY